jgi:anti-sigma factor RsiW
MTEDTKDTCRGILEHVAAYLDGELDATACLQIEAHCVGCDACALVVNGLRETVGLCRQAARAPLPEGVRALALGRVQRILKAGGTTGHSRAQRGPLAVSRESVRNR